MNNPAAAAAAVWLLGLLGLGLALAADASSITPGPDPVDHCKEPDGGSTCTSRIELFVETSNTDELLRPGQQYFDLCDGNTLTTEIPKQLLLTGEKMGQSILTMSFLTDEDCKLLCSKNYTVTDLISNMQRFDLSQGLILNNDYNFVVEGKPVTWCFDMKHGQQLCDNGFPIGCYVPVTSNENKNLCAKVLGVSPELLKLDTYYVFNHMEFTIVYNIVETGDQAFSPDTEVGRIMAVKFTPRSVKHYKHPVMVVGCDSPSVLIDISVDSIPSELYVTYSYSVKFQRTESVTRLAPDGHQRKTAYSRAKLFMLFNLLTILISLIVFSFIFVHYGLGKGNSSDSQIEDRNNFNRNFFQFSTGGIFLSVFTGSFIQVICLLLLTLVLGCVGYITSANPISLKTFWIILIYCFGIPAGYVSSRIYKRAGGKKWKTNIILTSLVCPGTLICLFIMMIVMDTDDVKTVFPVSTLLAILLLWLLVSVPLIFFGAIIGLRNYSTQQQQPPLNPEETLQFICTKALFQSE